jgi:hypothetical protein
MIFVLSPSPVTTASPTESCGQEAGHGDIAAAYGRGQDAVVTGVLEIREGAVSREGGPHEPIVATQRRDEDRVPLRSDQLRRAVRRATPETLTGVS